MRNAILALILASGASIFAQSTGPYSITHKLVIGGSGSWDYVVTDPPSHRIYVARSNRLMVIDADTGKLIGEVADIYGAHGTAIVPGSGHGFATSSDDKAVVMFDLKTLKILGKTPAAEDADAAIYDAPSNRGFTMNGDANSSTVVDGTTGKLIANIPLGGKPEYAVSAGDGKVYANLVDKAEIVEIDARTASLVRRWSTAPCKQPVAMAVDPAHHRLFTGCRSGVLAVSDYQAGKVITTVPIGQGVDSTGFDPSTGDIFTGNADGTLTIIHQDSADQYHVLQTLTTPIGSRNLGVDPLTHRIFVVSAQFAPPPAARRTVIPDTFTLLTIERTPAAH